MAIFLARNDAVPDDWISQIQPGGCEKWRDRAGRAAATLASRPGGDRGYRRRGAVRVQGGSASRQDPRHGRAAGTTSARASRRPRPREAPDRGWRGVPHRGSPPRHRLEAEPGRRRWRDDRTAERAARRALYVAEALGVAEVEVADRGAYPRLSPHRRTIVCLVRDGFSGAARVVLAPAAATSIRRHTTPCSSSRPIQPDPALGSAGGACVSRGEPPQPRRAPEPSASGRR